MASITYIVEPDAKNPWLLARVRFPDLCEAIGPKRPEWTHSLDFMDLVHGSDGEIVTEDEARKLAESWGATL